MSVSTLPHSFQQTDTAVVFNNEIHILGGYYNYDTTHYKWNGSAWTSVRTVTQNCNGGCAVVCDNSIHVLGNAESGKQHLHSIWDGSAWKLAKNLPYNFSHQGEAVCVDDSIHILGMSSTGKGHYVLNAKSYMEV